MAIRVLPGKMAYSAIAVNPGGLLPVSCVNRMQMQRLFGSMEVVAVLSVALACRRMLPKKQRHEQQTRIILLFRCVPTHVVLMIICLPGYCLCHTWSLYDQQQWPHVNHRGGFQLPVMFIT